VIVSCLMPTYNKMPRHQWLVEEAIESYYRNAAELKVPAELIVCNDSPSQVLTLADPRADVRIFNLDKRFASLGAKLNWMTAQAAGTHLCRWDDDDINLPWGLRLRYETMQREQLVYLCFSRFFATNGSKTSVGFGSFSQCMYLQTAAESIGGYGDSSFGEDQDIERKFRNKFGNKVCRRTPKPDTDTYFMYRWGTEGSDHLSGFGQSGNGWNRIGQRSVQAGTYVLKPHWREDYVERCRVAMERHRAGSKEKT